MVIAAIGVAVALAIAHHPRVEDRLLLTLWHLAERWGKVTPDGIVVPLPLAHRRLADLVGTYGPAATGPVVVPVTQEQLAELAGTSHYLEHLLFKGTARRDALAIAAQALMALQNAAFDMRKWAGTMPRDRAIRMYASTLLFGLFDDRAIG